MNVNDPAALLSRLAEFYGTDASFCLSCGVYHSPPVPVRGRLLPHEYLEVGHFLAMRLQVKP